jgi:hypothetical protein
MQVWQQQSLTVERERERERKKREKSEEEERLVSINAVHQSRQLV